MTMGLADFVDIFMVPNPRNVDMGGSVGSVASSWALTKLSLGDSSEDSSGE